MGVLKLKRKKMVFDEPIEKPVAQEVVEAVVPFPELDALPMPSAPVVMEYSEPNTTVIPPLELPLPSVEYPVPIQDEVSQPSPMEVLTRQVMMLTSAVNEIARAIQAIPPVQVSIPTPPVPAKKVWKVERNGKGEIMTVREEGLQ